MTSAATSLPCLYCSDQLTFGSSGWVHASTGRSYVGACRCDGVHHDYMTDEAGKVVCRTWRDNHIATPNRSKRGRR